MQVTHLIMANKPTTPEPQATPDFLAIHNDYTAKQLRIKHAQKRLNEIRGATEDIELALLAMCGIDEDDVDLLPLEARRVLGAVRAFANDKAAEVAHRALS